MPTRSDLARLGPSGGADTLADALAEMYERLVAPLRADLERVVEPLRGDLDALSGPERERFENWPLWDLHRRDRALLRRAAERARNTAPAPAERSPPRSCTDAARPAAGTVIAGTRRPFTIRTRTAA